jgi:hypothetical protein
LLGKKVMSSTDGSISKTAGRKDKKGILLHWSHSNGKKRKILQMRELPTFCRFSGIALLSMKQKIDEFGQPEHVLARLIIAMRLL